MKRSIEELFRLFKDEQDNIWTLEELEFDYDERKITGETEAETFEDYLLNCTDKNGTLTEITK